MILTVPAFLVLTRRGPDGRPAADATRPRTPAVGTLTRSTRLPSDLEAARRPAPKSPMGFVAVLAGAAGVGLPDLHHPSCLLRRMGPGSHRLSSPRRIAGAAPEAGPSRCPRTKVRSVPLPSLSQARTVTVSLSLAVYDLLARGLVPESSS